eukprot:TRINITY_DN20235_c0_g1_i2.p1 TRINITY_DN20235_c0_g1~~TRINITY_DN20235_c0_g1_i2.p1  ORF type:complete len:241 (-),score=84.92 TRINITY_DN20235_c0_g1_i2:324-1046(-)
MFSCRACSAGDQASDTLKIDVGEITAAGFKSPAAAVSDLQLKEDEERRHKGEMQAEREVARLHAEEEERQRRLQDIALRLRQEEEAAAAQKAEDERLQQECTATASEATRLRGEEAKLQQEGEERERQKKEAEEEAAQQQAEQARLAGEAEDKKKMDLFLRQHSFKGPDMKRSSFLRSYKFPLHSAVKHKDADMIRILLAHGATLNSKDSSGFTPVQLSEKVNKSGSHSDVIQAFSVVVN